MSKWCFNITAWWNKSCRRLFHTFSAMMNSNMQIWGLCTASELLLIQLTTWLAELDKATHWNSYSLRSYQTNTFSTLRNFFGITKTTCSRRSCCPIFGLTCFLTQSYINKGNFWFRMVFQAAVTEEWKTLINPSYPKHQQNWPSFLLHKSSGDFCVIWFPSFPCRIQRFLHIC